MANINQHQAAIHDIANKVDQLITNDNKAGSCFKRHITKLCKMVEDYAEALQPYAKKLKRAEKQWKQNKTTNKTLADFCLPLRGWVEIGCGDNLFINIEESVIRRPKEPVNPLLWFGFFGNANIQRPPTGKEKLMCGYVLLAIVHDCELQYSGTPIDRRIFSANYKGKWFERHKFCEDVWMYYHYEYPNPDMLHHPATAQERLSQLNRTLEYVHDDLARKKPAETKQNLKTTIVAIIISFIVDLVFELLVYFVPFTWFKNHPNSYGLQGSIIFLIPCLIVGLFKPQYRKWCWGVGAIAFIVLLLSLMGGPAENNVN